MPTIDTLRYILDLDTKKFVADSKRAETQTKKLSNTIGTKLKTAIMGVAGAYLGWRGLNMAVNLLKEGAAAEQTAMAFNNMARNIGFDGIRLMERLRTASKGAINDVNLMTIAMKAQVMGITADTLPQLMEIARASAIAFGQTTEFMFDSIVTGIARKQPLILDNLGIVVNLTEVYKKEAERLGHELTEAEKAQALLTATIEAGQKTIKQVGVDTKTAAENIASFTASLKNATSELGRFTSQGAKTGGVVWVLDQYAEYWRNINALMKTGLSFWEKLYLLGGGLLTYKEAVEAVNKENEKLMEHWMTVAHGADNPYLRVKEITKGIVDETLKWEKSLNTIVKHFSEIASAYKEIQRGYWPTPYQPQLTGAGAFPTITEAGEITFLQDISNKIKLFIMENEDAANLIQGAFDQIIYSIEGMAGDIMRIGAQLASKDFYSAGAGLVSLFIDLFTVDSQRIEEQRERNRQALERFTDSVQRNIDAINQLTQAEINRRMELIEAALAFERFETAEKMAEFTNIMMQLGYTIDEINAIFNEMHATQTTAVESMQALRDELNALILSAENFAALQQVGGFNQAMDFLTMLAGQGALGFQQGMNFINFFTEMFDLSVAQQEELIQTLQELLGDNLTAEEWMRIQESIDRLREEGIPVLSPTAQQPSQTLRSVTIITERQANIMVGVLNAIHLEIRKIVSRFDDLLEIIRYNAFPTGAGGGSVFYVNINVTGSTGQAIAQEFSTEMRKYGVKLG